jgi:GntR family transcriptional repressor for pyruvate dehydrogenase complex
MPPLQSIQHISRAEAIVQHLIARIRDGEFGPGDRLPSERLLQEELGVGRLALREGLARLSALGIIRIDHGRGAFVQTKASSHSLAHAMTPCFSVRDQKAMADLVYARGLIEGELSVLAAQCRQEDDIRNLEAILENPAVARMDENELANLDLAFHLEIARVANNEFLTVMLTAMRSHIHGYLVHYVRAVNDPVLVVNRHWPILRAIVDRNPGQAQQLARTHVKECKSKLHAYVEV